MNYKEHQAKLTKLALESKNKPVLTPLEIADGWRLLDDDEKDLPVGVETPKLAELECWLNDHWVADEWLGVGKLIAYRTWLSRAELRTARGFAPEPEPSKCRQIPAVSSDDAHMLNSIKSLKEHPSGLYAVLLSCQLRYQLSLIWNKQARKWHATIYVGNKCFQCHLPELYAALHGAVSQTIQHKDREALKQSALAKLTPEEREVLGFADPILPMKTTGLNYGDALNAVMADPDIGAWRRGAAAYISEKDCGKAWLSTKDLEATDWEIFNLYGPEE